jgi:hypothetical protein
MNMSIVNAFRKDLRELLIKYNLTLAVDIDGDTHGITENFIIMDDKGNQHILNHFSAYLDASDLK